MAHDVFVECARADQGFGEAVCRSLEDRGMRCWVAHRDLAAGADSSEAVTEAIKAARLLILVWSASSNASIFVLNEVRMASEAGIRILTVRVEDVRPTGAMEYLLAKVQWIDALTAPVEKHLDELSGVVARMLEDEQTVLDHEEARDGRPEPV